ncbi:MAG: response regulator [Deltaproteobacteria bacterium]|nr:response regulator [Deltaproteobacteria bacterium]MBW2121280.1 response regulator [Deltaproteobacteria bacterium]
MARRILVVDDDELVLVALRELLAPRGYAVTTVQSGAQALEEIENHRFDLLILDVIMPRMDGFQLCERIRATEGYSRTPIVMLTAKSDPDEEKRGLAAGADLFLPKPIPPQRLLDLIEATVEKGKRTGARNSH